MELYAMWFASGGMPCRCENLGKTIAEGAEDIHSTNIVGLVSQVWARKAGIERLAFLPLLIRSFFQGQPLLRITQICYTTPPSRLIDRTALTQFVW